MSSRKGYTKLTDSPGGYEEDDDLHYSDIDSQSQSYSQSHPGGQGPGTATKNKQSSTKSMNRGFAESSVFGGEVQNVKTKKVYVFSDGTIADNEDETIELNQMTKRTHLKSDQRSYKSTSSSQYADIMTKEIPLQKSDTLQSLSIKFRCPVPELKRINGLYNDSELFALTSVKIPVRSHQNILQQELDAVAKERMTASDELLSSKAKCAADIVSSETSDDEHFNNSSRQAVMDMVELHSDPEDGESYALLDRDWSQQKHKTLNNGKRDKRKFEKILNRKDEEFRVLAEKVQRQTDAAEDVTSFIGDAPILGPPIARPPNCLSTINLSMRCLVISIVLLAVIIPTIVGIHFYRERLANS